MKERYRSNQLLITMGEDFAFQHAQKYFERSDAFVDYFNTNVGPSNNVYLTYSTPAIFIDAVRQDNVEWPTKYDDLFPYGSDSMSNWVGFYSSRPLDKAYYRRGSQLLSSAE